MRPKNDNFVIINDNHFCDCEWSLKITLNHKCVLPFLKQITLNHKWDLPFFDEKTPILEAKQQLWLQKHCRKVKACYKTAKNTPMSFVVGSDLNFFPQISFVVRSDFFSKLSFIDINMSAENQKLPLLSDGESKNGPTLLKLFNIHP